MIRALSVMAAAATFLLRDVQAGPSGCGGASQDPNWGPYYYNGNCIAGCPDGTYTYGMTCYDNSCPAGTYAYFYDCMDTCPDGTYKYNGNCVGGCPARVYNGGCVDSCPAGTYDYNNACLDECPSYTVAYGTRCMDSCPNGLYKYNQECVGACPSTASFLYRGECRDECWKSGLYYKAPGSNECIDSCPKVYEWVNSTCIEQCAPNQKISGNGCYDHCPSNVAFANGNQCTTSCPVYLDVATLNCVDDCPDGTVLSGTRCNRMTPTVTPMPSPVTCPSNQEMGSDGICHEIPTCASTQYAGKDYQCHDYPLYGTVTVHCPPEAPFNMYGNCVNVCAIDMWVSNGECGYNCPNYFYKNGCKETCPETSVKVSDAKYRYCYDCPPGTTINSNKTGCDVLNSCPSTQTLGSDGVCHENTNTDCPTYMYRNSTDGTCVYWCGPDAVGFNGTCVHHCPSVAPFNDGSKCVERCADGFLPNMATGYCEYDCAGFWSTDGKCVERCPAGTFSVFDKYCIDKCPADTRQNGTRCDPLCANGQMIINGVCADWSEGGWGNWTDNGGNWTDNGSHCKPYEYLNSNGTCISYGPACAPDQWFWNGTCIPACREGEALTMDGKCMSVVDLCSSSLPGSVLNNVTRKCECPAGSWITRDREAKDPSRPPIRCDPAPASADLPRIDCPSFVPNSVYIANLENCACPSAYPIIVPVPDVTWFPYACAAPGTASPIKQCEWPSYFDFLEGGCVDSDSHSTPTVTAKPTAIVSSRPTPRMESVSATMTAKATATATALPSRFPSRSSSITRTPARSAVPGSPTPSTTPSRSVKPSGMVFAADVSRAPLPSLVAVRPPPAAAQKSPAPSPWPKRVELELPAEEKPAYIDARMTIAGANATEMAKPERIQQVQASLACTLRMPLENIRIQNITVTDAAGVESRVPVDPSAFMMVGDGSSDCYDFRNLTSSRRLLRALSGSASSAIHIDYAIVAPSDEILAMDTTQFNDVLSKSPVLVAAANSVGGSGVTAVATDTRRVVAIRPSASPGATASGGIDMRLALGVGISCFVAAVLAVTLSIFYCRETVKPKKAPAEQTPVTQNPRVVLVYEDQRQHQIVNPLSSAAFVDAGRVDYGPQTTRYSVQPVRQTHRPIFGTGV